MNIVEYLTLPLEERKAHIDLSTPCDFSGGRGGYRKNLMRKNLLNLLGIPYEPNIKKFGACVCHRCCNCTGKARDVYCVNPLHLYLGTLSENSKDTFNDNPGLKDRMALIALVNQPKASMAAMRDEARTKRKNTFKEIEHQVGTKNSQYGSFWVTNGTDSVKVPKGGQIPDGYWKGRKMNREP